MTLNDGTFTVSCKNATSGAVTKVKMKFNGASDGVAIFFFRLVGLPIAILFPHLIDMELMRSETGNDADLETINALLKAFQDKGVELKELIPSK